MRALALLSLLSWPLWARADLLVGASTTLSVTTSPSIMLRENGPAGQTRLELRPRAGGPAQVRVVDGLWVGLGFAAERKAYVLAGQFQRGAWLPITTIEYLDETGAPPWRSHCCDHDWMALAAVAGPGTRYVALVGGEDGTVDQLQVLDTVQDRLKVLGPPPSPPPLRRADWRAARDEPWQWGGFGSDGLTALDPGIVSFVGPDLLRVSYGRDSYRRRAKARVVRTWSLNAIFGRIFVMDLKLNESKVFEGLKVTLTDGGHKILMDENGKRGGDLSFAEITLQTATAPAKVVRLFHPSGTRASSVEFDDYSVTVQAMEWNGARVTLAISKVLKKQ